MSKAFGIAGDGKRLRQYVCVHSRASERPFEQCGYKRQISLQLLQSV